MQSGAARRRRRRIVDPIYAASEIGLGDISYRCCKTVQTDWIASYQARREAWSDDSSAKPAVANTENGLADGWARGAEAEGNLSII